ncbi:MAG TPA: phosphoenolpyruvate carboxykinase (ATP) [Anaerolineaceae bacterium]|nr:phosphoenolpyruvate carboxykinase (ATP) [Anaerolineaceae bacterium]HPN51660.1 phosphoenolpyruvate carboxykinase (ATP) [Anaerolineaceae bacterium]
MSFTLELNSHNPSSLLTGLTAIHTNLPVSQLAEHAVNNSEAVLGNAGALIVNTGKYTGRSPNDKFLVRYPDPDNNEKKVWWGKINQPFSPEKFEHLLQKMCAYFQGKAVYVQNVYAGAHPDYQLPIRVITESAWHNLFARDLFIRQAQTSEAHTPQFTVLNAPGFKASPDLDGTNSEAFIIVDFRRHLILIGGTSYAGEIKKSIFSIMNYLMPIRNVLSMHCSANVGKDGDTALFFGLSGTGKTTLSSDPLRRLIGDDEHGWGDDGVFNFEGGCYAKTIRLRPELEPLIWNAAQRFGSVLENVVFDPETREIDFDSEKLTENTRAAYPIDYIPNHIPEGKAGHPDNIFFLTADAFGVLPPIARLTADQAMYYFLSGYTSKLAGTEKGLGNEPQATFSTCFGSPFLPLFPDIYATLLGKKIQQHQSKVWLINTGWTGGAFGTGKRIHLPYTRAMIQAALSGALNAVEYRQDDHFGFSVPLTCPDVPAEILNPRQTWKEAQQYDQMAASLVSRFSKNFSQFEGMPLNIVQAGPH